MRKLRILLLWLGIVTYLVFVLGFVSGRMGGQVCERINVNITDSLTSRFISGSDIMNILMDNDPGILGYPLNTINTRRLEKLLSDEPFIKKADLYKTVNGALNVDVIQRQPVLRVINRQGKSYYIDQEGYILPVSEKYTSRILVANGHISEPFVDGSTRSIFDIDVPGNRRNAVIFDLYNLATFINGSDLWSSQIAQIYVNEKYDFELIPRVGAHVIYLGDAGKHETKFRKLEALYLYGLNDKGWNNYEIINLKYENQIICTKR